MPWLIFFVAFAGRLVHLWQIQPSPFFDVLLGDARGYDEWARRLAAGDWIGTEVFYQAPLYPYFVGVVYAVFGRDLLILRICQAVIGSASCALLGLTGTRLFSKPAGLVAGLALALYPPAIFFDGLLQKSVLDMFFVCLGLWLLSRIMTLRLATPVADDARRSLRASRLSWLALGLAMGGLALTRENAAVLIAVILVWALWAPTPPDVEAGLQSRLSPAKAGLKTRLYGRVLWFLAGLAVVLLPVAIRNYSVGGGLYLTTSQFGSNLYIGNNPTADGTYASIRFGRGAPEFERTDATEVAQEAVGRALTPAEVSSYWTGRAVTFITSQPGAWLTLTGRKVMLLFNATEMLDTESQESYAEWSWPLAAGAWVGHFGLLVPMAVFGLIVTWPERRRLWVFHLMAAAYAASVVLFFVFARYRYPLVPFLLLFAAAGAVGARGFWLTASARRQAATATALIVALVVAFWPLLSPTLMRAITENNLGTALQEAKRYDEAVAHHQRAIALMPDYAPAHNNLGASLRAAGRLDEAIAAYRRALALKPDFASASYNLANALLEKGQAGQSVDQFRRALQLAPDSVEAHNNLGIALAASGDLAGAMDAFRAALARDDRSAHAHRNLGNMLVDMGKRAEGLAHLERAVAVAPTEPEAAYDIGTLQLEEENFRGAAERFRQALAIRPGWAEAHNNLGIALASQGRLADALDQFERALKARPAYSEARANRDQARTALGRK